METLSKAQVHIPSSLISQQHGSKLRSRSILCRRGALLNRQNLCSLPPLPRRSPLSVINKEPHRKKLLRMQLRWRSCASSSSSSPPPPLPSPSDISIVKPIESDLMMPNVIRKAAVVSEEVGDFVQEAVSSSSSPSLSSSSSSLSSSSSSSSSSLSCNEGILLKEGKGESEVNNERLEFLEGDEEKSILQQMVDIAKFAGPALGIWLSGPLMSLIDTAVVGNSSSLELAALGPGTVFCDQLGYVFMFLSVATSNLIATSLAKKDENGAAQHLSRLLFVALTCGTIMFVSTLSFAEPLLKGFVGPENVALIPVACVYVKIRGFAWPAVLVGMVAQSASLGMQDSWNPLKVLAVASFANLFGDIVLCSICGYGIAGAAWATMASQYIGGFLMLKSLSGKGYSLNLGIPSGKELVHMIEIAAPVLLTMLSKVSFYAFITFLSTSLGPVILGAHQVMIGIYSTCTVSGEPLCQTAQSFMPGLIQGINPNMEKAKILLKSLLLIGALCGISLGCFAICFPWIFPQVFTSDIAIINQMRAVTVPFLCALVITPPLLALEGTLLAGRDFQFLSASMASCFITGSAMLIALKRMGFGLVGFWWTLAGFQTARFVASYTRLQSESSVLKDRRHFEAT